MAYSWQFHSQTSGHIYFDPNETKEVFIKLTNTGSTAWNKGGANPFRLGTANNHDRASGFFKSGNLGWLSNNRIEFEEAGPITNGQTATFRFEVTNGPNTRGCYIYREYFTPVVDGSGGGWIGPDPNLSLDFDCRAIGTFFYPWMTASYDPGGSKYLQGHHWTSTVSGENCTTDIPDLSGGSYSVPAGQYDSGDPEVINRQLELMTNAGINHVSISYAGHGDLTFHNANKMITEMYFNWPNMTFCMFMDNMRGINTSQYSVLNWYNSHPNIRVYDSKGLLLTFGNITPTNTTQFTQVSCGANDSTTGWIFGNTTLSPLRGACGAVVPRVDDRGIGVASGQVFYRTVTQTYDPNLSDDAHGIQFNIVKNSWQSSTLNQTRIVHFTTWNEYHERVGPYEPHVDKNINGATSPARSDTYLYDKLVTSVGEMRS